MQIQLESGFHQWQHDIMDLYYFRGKRESRREKERERERDS